MMGGFGGYMGPRGPSVWRGEHCPNRGPGLSHTQDSYKKPDGSCITCGVALHMTPPEGVPPSASEATPQRVEFATVFDHLYVFTLAGKCGRHNCGKHREAHADYLIGGLVTDCTVDHASVKPWSICPICQRIVEPKLTAQPTPESRADGGKVFLNDRLRGKLEDIYRAWLGGFFKS